MRISLASNIDIYQISDLNTSNNPTLERKIGKLTVRLSRSSCMINVLSLYDSSLSESSSAMASSKA